MPFKSEKQRRYMHANLPKIAQRWEKKYSIGGSVTKTDIPKIPKPEPYIGSYIKGDLGGVKVSNKSLLNYYKKLV